MARQKGTWFHGASLRCSLAAAALVSLVASGCSSTDAEAIKKAELSGGCTINSDCAGKLVCAFKRCHAQCEVDKDCAQPLRCMVSDKPFHVCQLVDETTCSYNSDCPDDQVCAADGKCRDMCSVDRDCVPGQLCTAGSCALPVELVDGGLPHSSDAGVSGQPCSYNSECDAPKVCHGGLCKLECLGARDCAEGQSCVNNVCRMVVPDGGGGGGGSAGASGSGGSAGAGGSGGSSGASGSGGSAGAGGSGGSAGADGGKPCAYTSECATGQICRNGACAPECLADIDCTTGERCSNRACVFDAPVGAPPGYGQVCSLTSQCDPGLYCGAAGRCVWQCANGADCAASQCCAPWHACVSGTICATDAGTTDSGADGGATDAGLGPDCVSDFTCQNSSTCDGFERCVAGHCRAGKPACDDANPCTTDSCVEPGTCTHTQIGPQDVDHDGHYALVCGGDDCDDTNVDAWPGNLEVCDLVDNNCDGAVDEGLWQLSAPPVAVSAAGQSYPYQQAPPAMLRRADGQFVVAATHDTFPGELSGWVLSPTLVAGSTTTIIQARIINMAASMPVWPSIASDGSTGLALGAWLFWSQCTGTYRSVAVRTQLDLSTPIASSLSPDLSGLTYSCYPTWGWEEVHAAAPDVAFNGTRYVLAWADSHEGGDPSTAHMYGATMDAAGVASGAHALAASLADVAVPTANGSPDTAYNPARLALGPTRAIVAFRYAPTGKLRYAIYDLSLATQLTPFVDMNDAEDVVVTSIANVGTSFVLAAQTLDGKGVRIHRLDQTTGAELGSVVLPLTPGRSDVHLAPMGGGVAVSIARGVTLSFGRMREDLADGVALFDIIDGAALGGAAIAPIDATHAAIAWSNGTVRAARVQCGP